MPRVPAVQVRNIKNVVVNCPENNDFQELFSCTSFFPFEYAQVAQAGTSQASMNKVA